jgi:POT family proton-dependent oligopeptide transporter
MMGMWYLSSFFGNYMTGYLGTFYETMPKDRFFLMLTLIAVITGIVIALLRRPIERAIGRPV